MHFDFLQCEQENIVFAVVQGLLLLSWGSVIIYMQ